MKTIIISRPSNLGYPAATHENASGERFLLSQVANEAKVFGNCEIKENKTIAETEQELGLVALEIPERYKPKPIVKQPKPISKLDLIDKLVALGLEDKFSLFIGNLPTSEKLRWDAAQTISPAYPFIVDNRDLIISSLGISDEQFNSIFI